MIYVSVLPNASTIEIDSEKYGVVVVFVMEASDGKRYYDHTVTGKNESPAGLLADPSTTEVDEESGRPFTGLSSEANIPEPDKNAITTIEIEDELGQRKNSFQTAKTKGLKPLKAPRLLPALWSLKRQG